MFVKTLQHMSPSELKLPKLHSWVYHIIDLIQFFGAVNGYTMETYKSLHKEYVKSPYRLSNKKNIEIQLMQIVSIIKLRTYTMKILIELNFFIDSTAINIKYNPSNTKFSNHSPCI